MFIKVEGFCFGPESGIGCEFGGSGEGIIY